MLSFLKKLNIFIRPTAEELAVENIEEYRRQYLNHQASSEYHKKMAEYYKEGIKRMQVFSNDFGNTNLKEQ